MEEKTNQEELVKEAVDQARETAEETGHRNETGDGVAGTKQTVSDDTQKTDAGDVSKEEADKEKADEEKTKADQAKTDEEKSKADQAENGEEKTEEDRTEKEKSAEKKKERKHKKEKDKRDEIIEDLKDKYTRQMAEFDNFRKRTEKEKSQMYEIGAKDIIEKILPVVDNFERGFDAVTEDDKDDAFVEGMNKIYKQLIQALEDMGVKPIEAVGQEFNPEFHNAVMHVDDEKVGENMVVEEFQKGYLYRDTVVRHSMVKVAN